MNNFIFISTINNILFLEIISPKITSHHGFYINLEKRYTVLNLMCITSVIICTKYNGNIYIFFKTERPRFRPIFGN